MKIVKLKINVFKRLVSALKKCRQKNKILNKQIEEYNKKFIKDRK